MADRVSLRLFVLNKGEDRPVDCFGALPMATQREVVQAAIEKAIPGFGDMGGSFEATVSIDPDDPSRIRERDSVLVELVMPRDQAQRLADGPWVAEPAASSMRREIATGSRSTAERMGVAASRSEFREQRQQQIRGTVARAIRQFGFRSVAAVLVEVAREHGHHAIERELTALMDRGRERAMDRTR